MVEEIPNDSAAAIMLVEHRWAIPLRDAIVRAGGFPISDGFIHPLDLVAIGLMTAAEAEADAAAAEVSGSTTDVFRPLDERRRTDSSRDGSLNSLQSNPR